MDHTPGGGSESRGCGLLAGKAQIEPTMPLYCPLWREVDIALSVKARCLEEFCSRPERTP